MTVRAAKPDIVKVAAARGARRRLPALVLVATLVASAAGFAVDHAAGLSATDAVGLALAVAWAVAGLLVWDTWRVPVASIAAMAAAIGLTAARYGERGHGRWGDLATILGLAITAGWVHWLLALPGGRLASTARRRAVAAVYGSATAYSLLLVATGSRYRVDVAAVLLTLATLTSLPALHRRYAGCSGRERDRLCWLGVGATLSGAVIVLVLALHAISDWPAALGPVTLAATVLVPVSLIAGEPSPLATHGGRVLVRALSIAGFTISMAAVYVVVVIGLGNAAEGSVDRETLRLSMVAAAIAVVAYIPTRGPLTAAATRFVYGTRQAPDEMVRTFGSRLTRAIPIDELLLQLVESLTRTMGLSRAEVYMGSDEVLEPAAAVPETERRSIVVSPKERQVITNAGVSGNAWVAIWLPVLLENGDDETVNQVRVAPIRNSGELLGLLVVERSPTADRFADDEDRVLADLARQLGLAFRNVALDSTLQTTLSELRAQAEELQESRARIVSSGDAERRRLERNLHDGAQQNLVALAVNLRLARDLLTTDPAATAELLDGLTVQVQQTIQELRELAHGIYPPLLIDDGISAALRAATTRNPMGVTITSSLVRRYAPEVEAAIYFCCLESLQNAAKHAPGAHVEVRLWEERGGLQFAVQDDGPGFETADARYGHGFVNMADRLGAIGGNLRWDSRPGEGTTVAGSLPL